MSNRIRLAAVLIAVVLTTVVLAGCTSDPDEADWKTPTQVQFDGLDVDETNETLDVQISLGDKNDKYTRASGTLRVAIFDSDGFEMLNKTYEVKDKDFDSIVFMGIKISAYNFEIPFSDVAKSHDRGYDMLAGDSTMSGMAWFTHKDDTFMDTYDLGWLNPDIPDALLHPNEAPQADLVVDNPGYVGMDVFCNASASMDAEGGTLDFAWDWGDGDTVDRLFAGAEESHSYDVAGTYTITLTVYDPEDAEDTKTMDVTVDWSLGITVNGWGTVTEGDYVDQTYVEVLMENMAPADISIPQAGVSGVMLKNAAEETTEVNGTDVTLPETLAIDEDVTVMFYFDPAEGFDATMIHLWGREFALP